VPALGPRLCYLFTFSKIYAMSGWRVGYMALPARLAPHVLKVHDAKMICAPRVSQVAAIAALADRGLPPAQFRDTLAARRALICARLDRLPQIFNYVRPEGAYYVFPRLVGPNRDSRAFAIRLLEKAGVVVTPGVAFGPGGEGHVRMAYCVGEATINGAFDRIEAFAAAEGL
jgi:aspartate/methionine/tyrosine aminotransferase